MLLSPVLVKYFYTLKPFIPRHLQIILRRQIILRQRSLSNHIWPIDPRSGKMPAEWCGWPECKRFALVLQHDVETKIGHDKCRSLMDIEESLGVRSSYNFVPEKYEVSPDMRQAIVLRGFEVGVHGIKHDGKLFASEQIFKNRSVAINQYLKNWGAVGFTSPSMHHRLEWMHRLDIEYGVTTFDTDPFEPQADGVGTIYPFWVSDEFGEKGYVEMPYTLPQDHTLFIIMRERDIRIWREKLDWIAGNRGMALLNTHPDYMKFGCGASGNKEYRSALYEEFLIYVKKKYHGQYWNALPREVARYYRSQLRGKEVGTLGYR